MARDVNYFQSVKITRGDIQNPDVDNIIDMNYFNSYNHCEHKDEDLKNLIENK